MSAGLTTGEELVLRVLRDGRPSPRTFAGDTRWYPALVSCLARRLCVRDARTGVYAITPDGERRLR